MSITSTDADTKPLDARPNTKQKIGLVLCGLYSLVNIPSALTPTPEGSGEAPPLGILVLGTICGVVGLVAAVMAWRGSAVAYRIAAGAIIVATLTAVPAFFVDVPMWVRALVGVAVLITVAAVVLMFSGASPHARRGLSATMIAVITVLLAFPLGFLVRSRLAAMTTHAVAYLWAFTFQTLYLLLDSLGGGSAPAFEHGEFPLSYGVVTLLIFVVGFGLAALGHWVGSRRRTGQPELETV